MQLLNIRKYGLLLVLLLSAAVVIVSCGDDDDEKEGECTTEGLTYDNSVKAILVMNCSTLNGCHVQANANVPRVGSFETYENAKIIVDSMRIIGAITHDPDFLPMPRGENKLDDCTIDKLTAWINAGAPE